MNAPELPAPAIGRVHVAILIDGWHQPGWVSELAHALLRTGLCNVTWLLPEAVASGLQPGADGLLWGAYHALDRRWLSPDARRALTASDLRLLHPDLKQVDVGGLDELDVILHCGLARPNTQLLAAPRLGVWHLEVSGVPMAGNSLPGAMDVMSRAPFTCFALKRLAALPSNDRTLLQSCTRTNHYSVARSAYNVARKARELPVRALMHVAHGIPLDDAGETGGVGLERIQTDAMAGHAPFRAVSMLGRLAQRAFQKVSRIDQWFLAYRFAGCDESFPHARDMVPLLPPKDRFWADPFPFARDGRHYVFFEELVFSRKKAHISVLEIDRAGCVSAPVTVLERDYHLSYPFLFEWNGELYMIPETGQNRTVELYRCIEFPHRWQFEKTLLEGIWAVDATLQELDGQWWLFVCQGIEGTEIYDELYLYHADTPFGPWHAHPMNPIVSDVRWARPAGRLFRHDGAWIRPAQNCAPIYGASVALRRIVELDATSYREEPFLDLLPDWHPNIEGFHTFNRSGEMLVVDGFMRRARWHA